MRIIITGAAGQDGLILGLKLARAGHRVSGIVRDEEQETLLKEYNPSVTTSVLNSASLNEIKRYLEEVQPDQIYHLSEKSSVAKSWQDSENTLYTNVFHTLNWLNALNDLKMHSTRFYHAASSEMFGLPKVVPQTEETLLHPRSPYGVSKVAAHHLVVNFRESFGQFASSGILFNHESPLPKTSFVTRKITSGVAQIARGLSDSITLGNLDISRDWGWAPDYVEGMISILNHETPDDFILATGNSHTLKEFLSIAFQMIGISQWETYVRFESSLNRPAEVISVVGDSSKARETLGWKPVTNFEGVIKQMLDFDLELLDGTDRSLMWMPS